MATQTKSKTTVRPLEDRILLRPDVAEEKTDSGIILPDTAREKPMRGEVIAVGPGRLNDDGERTPIEVKKGDKVIYGKFSGTPIEIDDEDLIILHERELLAKVEK